MPVASDSFTLIGKRMRKPLGPVEPAEALPIAELLGRIERSIASRRAA